ncbi:LysR family transcriptional regulator [Stutzerimonas stutzeri]|uniref:LysR family transcriptional regulator n=1 Tax=Stutzerimonas stutzeri TaxID=316 RepID=UPI002109C2EC|nr:LysR family transcriptional regulator [Stutzerimonas stutzeri]MCQ4258158.1 LysR family transcriptional regulator [Stutzerimonas stutzeri]
MLNLVWVNTFLALADIRSFQQAASQLGIAQPTVTQHIQKLEEKLGVTLFQRTRHGCKMTQAAQVFLPYARSLVRINDQALADLSRHQLRIGASSNVGIYLLPPLMKRYLEERAHSALELTIEANPSIAEKLQNGELDVALMEWWDGRPGFDAFCWKHEPVVLIVHPSHPLAASSSVSRDQVGQLHLLGGEPGTGTGRLLKNFFESDGAMPKVSRQLGSTEAVKQNVKAGLGVSLVMRSAVEEEVAYGSLCAIPLDDPSLAKPLYLVTREGQQNYSPPLRFAAFLRNSGN